MTGLFGILGVSARGLAITTNGVRTAGHNIANVDNPDFSRQQQILVNAPPLTTAAGLIGSGVEQVTIQRITDSFVQGQLLRQGSLFGSSDAQAQALAVVEEVLNETGGPGLTSALDAFYDAFSDLSAATAPGASTERTAVQATARSLIDTLQSLDTQLREHLAAEDRGIVQLLSQVNSLSAEIHALNGEIVRQETMAPANDLRDQRDAKLLALAELVDIRTFEEPAGNVVVTLGNGLPLVEGNSARQLVAVVDPTNPLDPTFSNVHYRDGSNDIDVTGLIGGGSLGGHLRARDTLIPAAIRSLDTVAYNVATSVNAVHNLGVGLNGAVGDFFAPLAGVEDAAGNLDLAAAIAASPDSIAAGLTSAPGDNRNALALAGLRDSPVTLFLPGDPPGPATGPTRTILEHVSTIAADVGEQARSASSARRQQEQVLQTIQNRRDEISGVSLDEEMAHLVELQAAFQANARVLTMVDRLLGDIIDLI